MLEQFLPYLVNGLVEGAIYALIALGYTMVYGILGMINFAHGEIYMLGGYAGIIGFSILVSTGVVAASLPLAMVLAFVFAMTVCAMYGATLERVAYRPLRKAGSLTPLISAIGASFFLWNFVMVAQGDRQKSVPEAVRKDLVTERVGGLGLDVSWLEVMILVTALVAMIGLQVFIKRSRLGKAMRATAQDRTMASLVGIPVDRVISWTFVLGSALASIAGVLVAMYTSVMGFRDGYIPGIKAFTAAVLGGIGNIPGAMVGGFCLGIAENVGVWEPLSTANLLGLQHFLGQSDYKNVYSFAILLLVLIFRPRGLLGERVADKV
jgi:branched-chain amino acid transport system permease protein